MSVLAVCRSSSNGRLVSKLLPTASAREVVLSQRISHSLRRSQCFAVHGRRQLHSTPSQWQQPTTDSSPATPTFTTTQERDPPTSAPRKPRRSLRVYIYVTSFLLLGVAGGQFARAVVLPPPLPIPDSSEDEYMASKIRRDIGKLPLVQELRARRDDWLEYEAYMDKPPAEAASSLTAGAMRGTRGLGAQRIFYNKRERKLVNVVFIGGALSGWPGVVHGGALATLLCENMERVVNGPDIQKASEERGSSADKGRGRLRLDSIDIDYRKPSHANAIFIIRAAVDGKDEDWLSSEKGNSAPGSLKVKATLENAVDGLLCVEARGEASASHENTVASLRQHSAENASVLGSWGHRITHFFG